MAILFPSPIFGPIKSRRLGVSLGINLMPSDGKVCTFDCIYCECGLNADHRPKLKRPSRQEVREALEQRLQQMQAEQCAPDVLTFAGNGEPTAHPDFAGIIDDTLALRDVYFPKAQVSVLSNATMLHKPEVVAALKRVDNNILKLDTVSQEYIKLVDQPTGAYDVERVVEQLCAFEGKLIVQTLFMKGAFDGRSVDNTTDDYVLPWLSAVQRIAPQQVMIYTIDRATPVSGLLKATPAELDAIAMRVRELGIAASASY
ncbi:MAG: radical SAM protein [Bacteroidaceae bacterium]|nr:radical SAM protein [Bacteroidaceae bacterium]